MRGSREEPGCSFALCRPERVSGGSWEEIDSSPKLPWKLILPENSRQNWRWGVGRFLMFQATRRRLALWYTAVTAALLLIFASGVYLYVHNTLVERVDDTLHHVVEVVERSLVIEPNYPDASQFRINIEASFRDNADTVEDDHIDLEWFSPTGELLWSTLSEPLDLPIHFNRTGETVRLTSQHDSNSSPLLPAFLTN